MKFPAFLFGALLAASSVLSSCNQQPAAETTSSAATSSTDSTATAAEPAATTPVKAAMYECPMGCEGSASAEPGKCPVCGMDLEKKS